MDLFLYNLPHWGAFFIYHSTNSYSSGCNGGKLGIGILPNDIWHADWSRKRSNYQPSDLLDDLLYVLSHSQKIIIIGFQFINILQQTLKKKEKRKRKLAWENEAQWWDVYTVQETFILKLTFFSDWYIVVLSSSLVKTSAGVSIKAKKNLYNKTVFYKILHLWTFNTLEVW